MAQGTFPITEARQTLGVTPATSQRLDPNALNVASGAVGTAVGQGAVELGAKAIQEKKRQDARRAAVEAKRQQMVDGNSAVLAQGLRQAESDRMTAEKLVTPQEQWEELTLKGAADLANQISQLDGSPDFHENQSARSKAYTTVQSAKAFTDSTRQLRTDTIETQATAGLEAFSSDDPAKKADFIKRYKELGPAMGKDKSEVLNDIKGFMEDGAKIMSANATNGVYASIEVASKTGDFSAAKTLATNPAIPESKQATLRSAIGTAETARENKIEEQKQNAINVGTSTAIRESYQGTLTVSELDKRHAAGLIKDPAYESMRKSLAVKTPQESDPMVASEMSNAITQLGANQISREDAQNKFLDSLPFLDETDRTKFVAAIEKETVALVETAMSEAKDAGKELISPKFQQFDPFSIKKFDNPEDERRFNLEWRLRNQYNDALDEWKESQKDKVITPSDVRRIENDLLIDYRKIRSRGLDAIGVAVETEKAPLPPAPLQETKTLRKLSIERLKAKREALRKQLK